MVLRERRLRRAASRRATPSSPSPSTRTCASARTTPIRSQCAVARRLALVLRRSASTATSASLLGDAVHIALDGVTVTTPEVDEAGAMVVVDTEVQNESPHTRTVRGGDDAHRTRTAPSSADRRVRRSRVRPDTTAVVHQRLYLVAAPQRWSVDASRTCTPAARALLDDDEVLDEESTTFGIRTLSLDPSPRPADQRRDGEAARRLRPPRQRAASARPPSTGPRSVGSSCSRRPASTRSAARTTR